MAAGDAPSGPDPPDPPGLPGLPGSPQAVLREATDRRLFEEVIGRVRATRAELAAATGFSKPTVSESVRRLAGGGLLAATGRRETGRRGRVGTFYELGPAAGWVLAAEVDQAGVQARSADLAGGELRRHERPPGAAGDTRALAGALLAVAREAIEAIEAAGGEHGPLRAVAVSLAAPVHPATHEVIALADAFFPEGMVSPAEILVPLVDAPVLVDNDVNLAALAEHRTGAAAGAASFAYVYIGAGPGLGLYIGDRLVRGAHGLAGEIGYLPGSPSGTLAADLTAHGFGRPNAPSTDVAAVRRLLDRAGDPDVHEDLRTFSGIIARAISSVGAVVDPELVLLGGPLGAHPELLPRVRDALDGITPIPTRLARGALGPLAPLHGATHLALDHAKAAAIGRC